MSVNGKFDGITLADLEAVGDRHLVPRYRAVIGEVLQAVDRWPEFAGAAGLGTPVTERIAADLARYRPGGPTGRG
jgi:serine/threonine-protein kinase HipA